MPFLQYSNIGNINVKRRERKSKAKPIAKNVKHRQNQYIKKYYNCVWKAAEAEKTRH